MDNCEIRGIVVPVEWDEEGDILAVSILTDDEDEYAVDHHGKGSEFLNLINAEVEVDGYVDIVSGEKRIKIISYLIKRRWS
ncbi:MAG: hypothetical protein JXC33_05750 [Deltaproteobacteria bacterium]|nr:hypothetical protein [Deltaproteobacteria bacterium]